MHISVTFMLITFFVGNFFQLFQRIRNQRKILRFLIPILYFFVKIFFLGHRILSVHFEAKRGRNGSIKRKTYLVNVS